MTGSIPQIIVQSSICLAIFYAFYWLFLRKETFHQANRAYLLLAPLVSIAIAIIRFDISHQEPVATYSIDSEKTDTLVQRLTEVVTPFIKTVDKAEILFNENVQNYRPVDQFTIGELLGMIYVTGVVFLFVRLFLNMRRLRKLILSAQRKKNAEGYTLVKIPGELPAASFFGYIFWKSETLNEEERWILEHEMVHIRQWHSLDVILMEVLVALNWFNPVIYLYRFHLKLTHEYIADHYVAQYLTGAYQYAQVLVKQSLQQIAEPLITTFHSLTKNRLIMLGKKPSNPWRGWRYAAGLPLFAALFLLFSFDSMQENSIGVKENIKKVSNALHALSQTPVQNLLNPPKTYQLRWGSHTCDCRTDQFEQYFACKSMSLSLPEFRNLARKGGFRLYEDGKEVNFIELQVQSKRMLDFGKYNSSFDFQGSFQSKSSTWRRVEEGDIIKFTFNRNRKDYFHFTLGLQPKNEQMDFAYNIFIGDLWVPVDMTSNIAIMHITRDQFVEAAKSQQLRIEKNDGQPADLSYISTTASSGFTQRFENFEQSTFDLKPVHSIQEIVDGTSSRRGWNAKIGLYAPAGVVQEKIDLSIVFKKDYINQEDEPIKFIRESNAGIVCGNHPFDFGRSSVSMMMKVQSNELDKIKAHPLEFFVAGRRFKILSIQEVVNQTEYDTWIRQNKQKIQGFGIKIPNYQTSYLTLVKMIESAKLGDYLRIIQAKAEDQLVMDFSIFIDDSVDLLKYFEGGAEHVLYAFQRPAGNPANHPAYYTEHSNTSASGSIELYDINPKGWDKVKDFNLYNNTPPLYFVGEERYEGPSAAAYLEAIPWQDIESIRFEKPYWAIPNYGDAARNGVFIISKKNHKAKGETRVILPEQSRPKVDLEYVWLFIDGELYGQIMTRNLDDHVTLSEVHSVNIYRGEEAVDKFGKKYEQGVMVIRRRQPTNGIDNSIPQHNKTWREGLKSHLYIINGEVIGGFEDFQKAYSYFSQKYGQAKETIFLTKEEALKKYGKQGKNGAVEFVFPGN